MIRSNIPYEWQYYNRRKPLKHEENELTSMISRLEREKQQLEEKIQKSKVELEKLKR